MGILDPRNIDHFLRVCLNHTNMYSASFQNDVVRQRRHIISKQQAHILPILAEKFKPGEVISNQALYQTLKKWSMFLGSKIPISDVPQIFPQKI